jgi:dienelactone hydrolase
MPLLRHGILAIGFALPLLAAAQLDTPALRGAAARAPDLTFPAKTSEFSIFTTPSMALYKPAGDGPFPALVLQHQCGGLGHGKWQKQSMLEWARRAVRHGYVALLIDSLGPRGVDSVCMGPQGGVTPMRGVRDALQAAAYLGTFDFVDKTRIAHAGYSWGALVGVGLSG